MGIGLGGESGMISGGLFGRDWKASDECPNIRVNSPGHKYQRDTLVRVESPNPLIPLSILHCLSCGICRSVP